MEKKYITLKNGEKYAYIEQGKGPETLVLIHGNFSSSLHFSPLFDKGLENVKLIAMDLRGFGDSTYNNNVETLEDLAHDVNLFLEELDIKKAHILGWSLGAGVALEFAANYPNKTEKLILMSPASYRGYPVFKKDEKGQFILGEVYKTKAELGMDPIQVLPLLMAQKNNDINTISYIFGLTVYNMKKPNQENLNMWMTESLKQRNLVDVDWALANFNMSNYNTLYSKGKDTIKNVKAKTLILWGKNDITVPKIMVDENMTALKDQATLIEYDNCGHAPVVDVLEDVVEDILNFIRG